MIQWKVPICFDGKLVGCFIGQLGLEVIAIHDALAHAIAVQRCPDQFEDFFLAARSKVSKNQRI